MPKPLALVWTKHLKDSKEKETFEASLRNSKVALSRMQQILDEMERDLSASETSIKDFEDPNWSHKQAFKNGQRSSIKTLRQLIDFI